MVAKLHQALLRAPSFSREVSCSCCELLVHPGTLLLLLIDFLLHIEWQSALELVGRLGKCQRWGPRPLMKAMRRKLHAEFHVGFI